MEFLNIQHDVPEDSSKTSSSSQSLFKYITSDEDHLTNQSASKNFALMMRKQHDRSDASKVIKKQCYTERRKRKLAENEKIGNCRICGQVKATGSKGMCNPCYLRERRISIEYKTGLRRVCDKCKLMRLCPVRGLCRICYYKEIGKTNKVEEERNYGNLETDLKDNDEDQVEVLVLDGEERLDNKICGKYKRLVKCGVCNEERLLCAKNMCGPCYKKELQLKKKANVNGADFCSSCGEIGVECYDRKCGKCHYKEGQKKSATVHAVSMVSLTQFNAQPSRQSTSCPKQLESGLSTSKETCNQLDEVTLLSFINTLDFLIQENNQRKPDPDVIVIE